MAEVAPVRRVTRIRHEVRRREVAVSRVERISANFLGITFAGEALSDFRSDGFDDHVKFRFADGAGEWVSRDFTPRHHRADGAELTIEFALHDHGAACDWARLAAPGTAAVIAGPKNSMVIPTDYAWHLLAGDATALPAIHRRLKELPAATRAIVVVQLDDAADRRALACAADLQLHWLAAGQDLAGFLRDLPWPAGEGFAWCAGEAEAMARVRGMLMDERGHPREAMRVAAYWKKDESAFHQTLEGSAAGERS